MKKNLLLLLIMAAAMTGIYAGNYDLPPYEPYLKDITYNPKTQELSFEDTYKADEAINRLHIVEFYYRTNDTKIIGIVDGANPGWTYGDGNVSTQIHDVDTGEPVKQRFYGGKQKGGKHYLKISKGIAACLKAGEGRLFIAIRGHESDDKWEKNTAYEVAQGGKNERGCHIKNNIEVNLTNFVELELEAPKEVYFGKDYTVRLNFRGIDYTSMRLQTRTEGGEWFANGGAYFSLAEARTGVKKDFTFSFNNHHSSPVRYYRAIVEDMTTHECDTTEEVKVKFYYKWQYGDELSYYKPGDTIDYPKLADECMTYKVICEWDGCRTWEEGNKVFFTQPNYNAELTTVQKQYTVKFLNSDYTVLKTEKVNCGEDATPPDETPKMGDMLFREWSRDYTNVHENMSVIARYDMGNYYLSAELAEHKNENYPFAGFAESNERVMLDDQLVFETQVQAPAASNISYEVAYWNDAKNDWGDYGDGIMVAQYSAEDAAAKKVNTYTTTIDVGIINYGHQVKPFLRRMSVRFAMAGNGDKVYSEPYEFEIYYPMYVKSMIDDPADPQFAASLQAYNTDGDMNEGTYFLMPVRYQDTLFVQMGDGAGGCLQFARKDKPKGSLTTGVDDRGVAWIMGVGEPETIEVKTSRKVVWFDGTKEKTSYDFSAQELGKYNAYYAEIVNCGGSIKNMPADPVWEGRVFLGWKKGLDGEEYADDAYLNVPAIGWNGVQFTAQWEDPADPELHDVTFMGGLDGKTELKKQQVVEGADAAAPPVPVIPGYTFLGWDKSYNMVIEDIVVTAIYGKDNTTWTVTYKNGNEVIGTEEVADGHTALGMEVSAAGKKFIGWDEDLRYVHNDITTYAQFEEIVFTVIFRVDGQEVKNVDAVFGMSVQSIMPPLTPTKEQTEAVYYTFDGWSPNVTVVESDLVLDAVFTAHPRTYTVTFIGWNGDPCETQTVEYGKSADKPATPYCPEDWVFTGWDKSYDNITEDVTITAQFSEKPDVPTYKVTIAIMEHATVVVLNDDPVDLTQVPENTVLQLKATVDEGYQFVEWMDGVKTIQRELTVTEDTIVSVVVEETDQAVEQVMFENGPAKVLYNGQLYILHNGRKYNATGKEMK